MEPLLIIAAIIALLAVIIVVKSVALVPQAEAAVVERLGRYTKTVSGQLLFLMPFVDRIRAKVDLRERVVSFPPQPVITEDNLTLSIDTVVYFQVTNPRAAVYEIDDYIAGAVASFRHDLAGDDAALVEVPGGHFTLVDPAHATWPTVYGQITDLLA